MADLKGRVFERLSGGGIGRIIPEAKLIFIRERSRSKKTVETDRRGTYKIELKPASYHAKVIHPDYQEYTTGSGFIIVQNNSSIANFFLSPSDMGREPVMSVFRGRVFERLTNGAIGAVIPEAQITFISEETSKIYSVKSAESGSYSIKLPVGRYIVTANREGYEPYSSEPGFFVLRSQPGTANIFLEKSQLTVVPNNFTFKGDRIYNRRTTL